MIKALDAGPARIPVLMARVEEELAWFDGVLNARGRHLVGSAFGRADLTVASLLAPLARPPASPVHGLYAGVVYPSIVEEALSQWSARPSLAWVQRTYAEYRRVN
jgi:glutathione S-transferase